VQDKKKLLTSKLNLELKANL